MSRISQNATERCRTIAARLDAGDFSVCDSEADFIARHRGPIHRARSAQRDLAGIGARRGKVEDSGYGDADDDEPPPIKKPIDEADLDSESELEDSGREICENCNGSGID